MLFVAGWVKMPFPGKVAIIVEVETKEGKLDEFLSLIREHARLSREEPGCLRFEVLAECGRDGVAASNKVWLNELYVDEAAVAFHESTDRMKALGAKLGDVVKSMRLIHGAMDASCE